MKECNPHYIYVLISYTTFIILPSNLKYVTQLMALGISQHYTNKCTVVLLTHYFKLKFLVSLATLKVSIGILSTTLT